MDKIMMISICNRVRTIIKSSASVRVDLFVNHRHLQAYVLDIALGENLYIKYEKAKQYPLTGTGFITYEEEDGVFCLPYDKEYVQAVDISFTNPKSIYSNQITNSWDEHCGVKGGYIQAYIQMPLDDGAEDIMFFYSKVDYNEYMKSEGWANKRKEALDRAHNRCQLCALEYNLRVHHNSYSNLGDEREEDLIVLCDECHKKYHGK